jgi:hypothetical protein
MDDAQFSYITNIKKAKNKKQKQKQHCGVVDSGLEEWMCVMCTLQVKSIKDKKIL